ncbi:MAG: CDP-diacylglycerol--serine O-phosphatidyltransferase [bacterium]|nr:MAG: CDP-diacylglycerol--serine O-phosphatidyltransferase [bacterium]
MNNAKNSVPHRQMDIQPVSADPSSVGETAGDRISSRRAIYLLPNMITTLALFSGFISVVASLNGEFVRASVAIIAAGLFDALDGRIARMTRTSSLFGVQYDSLSDIVAFGMAPAILMYTAVLQPLGRFGWLGAFLFLACGALRLARYNVEAQKVGQKHFTGLPIPAAAGVVATGMLLIGDQGLPSGFVEVLVILTVYLLSFLMISTVPYPSLKQVVIPRRKAFQVLAGLVVCLVLVANYPAHFLFGFGVTYTVLGPVLGTWVLRKLGSEDIEHMESFTLEDEDILETTGEEVVTRHGTQRERP